MDLITNIAERFDRISVFAELRVPARELPVAALRLSDASVLEISRDLAGIANDIARLQALFAGVAAHRSQRSAGQSGLAATQGHGSPASLIQAITGGTKADATRHVRVGSALLEDALAGSDGRQGDDSRGDAGPDAAETDAAAVTHAAVLREALMAGRLTTPQHDTIRRGLADPRDDSPDARTVWATAARHLIDDAAGLTVEDLAIRARALRDSLDLIGAEERFAQRYANRSFRTWIDDTGQHHGRIVFDDEMALWVHAIRDAALRPRRGGPRFMTDEERAAATALVDDPRTNDQLQYDLFMSILRAGSLAEASDVFGARQPGVRVVTIETAPEHDAERRDAFGRLRAAGYAEDGGHVLPGSLIDRAVCTSGTTRLRFDETGNPLDVGHEHRLFTPKQRIALAVRDGGCAWTGCSTPASYCEAHHIDHVADGGRTDINRGILLCRHHHLLLHNHGWKIRREHTGPFTLHPPPGDHRDPITVQSHATWKWAWNPPTPPPRAHWRAA
ncbi:HNH endonuclease signature motif containing protein [Microbacterium sp. SLBN-146]|uniref:HNH endonuclease signature motif containing protein n=1 Tax=Microbacterium sp. SLBN-146 TaxID=2768457 RepID=UPI00115270AE|nr:HNH endonuclease signature motif containing protein [Microbacterium sp. SLBN-146]TQJ31053.1 uncharacterized protein DUF222 [Microbacterium sp. SLBN-146]